MKYQQDCLCSEDTKISNHNHKYEIAYMKLKAIYPLIEGFCREANAEPCPPGGQQAGIDRSWAKNIHSPMVLRDLRRYAKEFKVRLEDYTLDYYEYDKDKEEEKKFNESLK